ncbi:MAG: divalent metal cation transporter [Nitrospirae bacterium]|nr:divalent metal cation transporter [Nitrospirota bacterium]NTW65526.1 divalent metal cation transporter [Nitrospirota bacterium]
MKNTFVNNRFLTVLSVIGPGFIAGNAGNDAGGIATYSIVGAREGYGLLWALILITFALAVIQEMSSRMGVVTGKGFGDLVREQFGIRVTLAIMALFVFANVTVIIAEFAGIAASMELFGVHKNVSVPISAFVVWFVVVKGNFKQVERFLIAISLIYLTYVFSGVMSDPPWREVARQIMIPHIRLDKDYFLLFITMVGTTITPYMQFYLQSAVVDKGVRIDEYRYAKFDVYAGSFMTVFIAFFIVLSTGTILHPAGVIVDSAENAAQALQPLAGDFAAHLFAIGLLNASFLAAFVLPLATAYGLSEAFGWESGVNKTFREAPQFLGFYTAFIVIGAGVIMVPNAPLIKIMFLSQTINGVLLPVVLIIMLRLVNDASIMGEFVNSKRMNVITWFTVAVLILLTVMLLVTSFVYTF